MNSPWHTIGGLVKYFRFSVDQILWQISFANVQMLLATIPVYNSKSSKKEEVIDAGDISNLPI